MSLFIRIGLWLASLLISVSLFSLITVPIFAGPGYRGGSFFFIFKATVICAGPAWLGFLLLVARFKNAEGRRFWILLASGILIGPASLCVAGLFGPLSDPLGPSTEALFLFALIVGSLTTLFYVLALKFAHHNQRPKI